ncbi:hemerythrin [Natranaerovirga hydrolytica]|uniref:Hemerythrin n=1 Tax=Natranaerovirga hydrolytica TaxID=680378 RepID=A0A4R1MZK6_9FIRM|nr:hemerythrin family protein [Natranaerovirga hydrolytica]TCK98716.1 hemerythrin [Natranaerovirga hydrolytica]
MMWKDKYEVGVDLIDEQHKELFTRVSDFIQTVQSKGDWQAKEEKVKETMQFMQEYVVTHFDDEEKYQESINYPNKNEHKNLHAKFKYDVNQYVEKFQTNGYDEELVKEFSGKLMTWLIMHVGLEDQKIGQYVATKGGNA